MASVFEKVKRNITVKQAAEFYGLQVKQSGMCCCPFHRDRHPSMKLNDRYYYCFSCRANGDVVSLASHLLGLPPYEAALRLAADFHIDPKTPVKHTGGRKTVSAVYCRRMVCDYKKLLNRRIQKYAPASLNDDYDDRFCDAVNRLEKAEVLTDELFSSDWDVRKSAADELLKSGSLEHMKQYISNHSEETDE